jgi:hypothetical protein
VRRGRTGHTLTFAHCAHAAEDGKNTAAAAVTAVIDEILARPEHRWQEGG